MLKSSPGESVEESDDLGPRELKLLLVRVVAEEDLESGAQTQSLHLAPQATLVTPDTVHDARDIAKLALKLLAQLLGLVALEQRPLVKVTLERPDRVEQVAHRQRQVLVLLLLRVARLGLQLARAAAARVEQRRLVEQVRRRLLQRPQLDQIDEVDVLEPLGAERVGALGIEASLELLRIRAPVVQLVVDGTHTAVQELGRQVNVYTGMQAAYQPEEDPLL